MTLEELQAAYDKLTADHADLQSRFDQTAAFILDLQKQLQQEKDDHAATEHQRDTFEKGFQTQSAYNEELQERLRNLRAGLPEKEKIRIGKPPRVKMAVSASPSPEAEK